MNIEKAQAVETIPEQLRYLPQIKSDVILQRRNLSLAPTEAAAFYNRDGTNVCTWQLVGGNRLHQLADPRSIHFQMQVQFKKGFPIEDAGMLFEQVTISSNGKVIENIRNA